MKDLRNIVPERVLKEAMKVLGTEFPEDVSHLDLLAAMHNLKLRDDIAQRMSGRNR